MVKFYYLAYKISVDSGNSVFDDSLKRTRCPRC